MCKLIIEGSLEVRLPTVWTDVAAGRRAVREEKRREETRRDEKGREEKRREEKRREEERSKKRKSEETRRKKTKHYVFPMICGSGLRRVEK
jgi:hypothetical protein